MRRFLLVPCSRSSPGRRLRCLRGPAARTSSARPPSPAGDALTVRGKVAGLGDETQINVAVTADVACVNPGNNEPKAENKGATIAEGTFPVQNGKALFSVTGTGTTQPGLQPAHDPALQQRGGHRERRQLRPGPGVRLLRHLLADSARGAPSARYDAANPAAPGGAPEPMVRSRRRLRGTALGDVGRQQRRRPECRPGVERTTANLPVSNGYVDLTITPLTWGNGG